LKEQKKSQKEKDDDLRAGADVGKIVNLMSGDASRVSSIYPGRSDILIQGLGQPNGFRSVLHLWRLV